GRHFSVNRMLTQDSVKLRLDREQPLSFLEFNYPILQAYDFVELNRRFGCELQIGGSDQWGNIVAGVELGRRVAGKTLFGRTTPRPRPRAPSSRAAALASSCRGSRCRAMRSNAASRRSNCLPEPVSRSPTVRRAG